MYFGYVPIRQEKEKEENVGSIALYITKELLYHQRTFMSPIDFYITNQTFISPINFYITNQIFKFIRRYHNNDKIFQKILEEIRINYPV